MYSRCTNIKSFFQNVRNISTNVCLQAKKNHYDSLGITPKATQADVKSAYYELSKMYHPDKSSSKEAHAEKFRDITEAYEVLGNVRLRKLYDKGMYHSKPKIMRHEEEQEDDPVIKFYKSRERRHKPPPPSGRTPIYDFDEWSRQHYGARFKKDQEIKKHQNFMREQRELDIHNANIEKVLMTMGALLLVIIYVFQEDYDKVTTTNSGSKKSANEKK